MVKPLNRATALLPKTSISRATKATTRTAAILLTLRPRINSKDTMTRTSNTGRISNRAIMSRSRAMVSKITVLHNMANLVRLVVLLKATVALARP
jgi:hypothetical protein